jgi:hypothetical protein
MDETTIRQPQGSLLANPGLRWRFLEAAMFIDPNALSSIAAAVSALGNEYLKGIASDAGKATWTRIRSLLGWTSDPAATEISEKVTDAVAASPEIASKLLELLRTNEIGQAGVLVRKVEIRGGRVVFAGNISHLQM